MKISIREISQCSTFGNQQGHMFPIGIWNHEECLHRFAQTLYEFRFISIQIMSHNRESYLWLDCPRWCHHISWCNHTDSVSLRTRWAAWGTSLCSRISGHLYWTLRSLCKVWWRVISCSDGNGSEDLWGKHRGKQATARNRSAGDNPWTRAHSTTWNNKSVGE
jgi:hypothetical protein